MISPSRVTGVGLVLLFSAAVVAVAPVAAQTTTPNLIGYSVTSAAQERQIEAGVAKLIDAASARTLSREFSQEPHMAGTPAQARTRDMFANYLRADGMTPEIRTYSIYMPFATSVHLYRVSPAPEELSLAEGPIAEDTTTFAYPQVVTFNGYGAAGDVTGDVVYVNYGLVEDYRTLDSLGISVKGKIAIARYGKSYRGIKAREAEKHGAVGLIIYSDPTEDGYTKGDVYPEGPMRSEQGVQRGSVYNDNGDPTTPDYPSLPGAKRIPLDQTTLPKIPVIPIGYKNAMELLRDIRGKDIPKGWQGALPFHYHIGPGPVQARIVVTTDEKTQAYKDIWDVLGTIRGTEYPDELVIVGGHRDAWGPGATDNVSGTVAVLEAARAISELVKQGYRPKRTIIFASWDAEEWGLMGSTEYVEQDSARLFKYGVAYLNQDMVAYGPSLDASASPSLRPLFRDITKIVPNPDGQGSVYDAWRRASNLASDTLEPPMDDPGGGSDFAGFYNHLGIPISDWNFNGPEGMYHSAFDTFHWIEKFGDPTFSYHVTTSVMTALNLLRLANADILPYDYVEYAKAMRALTQDATKNIQAKGWNASTDSLFAAIARMESAARAFNAVRDSALQHPISAQTSQRTNALLLQVERAFVRPQGLYGREWFRNVIYAADNDNGYDNIGLPTINEAVRAGDEPRTVKELDSLVHCFDSASYLLTEAAQSLR